MDLSYRMMDQVLKAAELPQASAQTRGADQKSGKKDGDFDSMVRQKQQQARGKNAAQNAPRNGSQNEEEAVPEEQYVAAALFLQMQQVVDFIAPRTDLETAPIELLHPETIVEAELPQIVSELPVEAAATQDAGPEFIEIVPELSRMDVQADRFDESQLPVIQVDDGEDAAEDLPAETPVFGELDAAPVRVSEHTEAPVELERSDAAEDLAARIEDLVTDENGNDHIELTLTPASLGKITVDITHMADGSLHIALSATTEKAMGLLERNSSGLQGLLSSSTRPTVQIEVRGNEEAQQQFLNPNDSNGQQQRRQQNSNRRKREDEHRSYDFVQQLRLGLVDLSAG